VSQYRKCGRFLAKVTREFADARGVFDSQARVFHNNLAMNRSVEQVAKRFVDGNKLEEGMLNRVQAVVRAYDPCLSCSTHAAGQIPLRVQLFAADGTMVDEVATR
jgi:hypothetical protein